MRAGSFWRTEINCWFHPLPWLFFHLLVFSTITTCLLNEAQFEANCLILSLFSLPHYSMSLYILHSPIEVSVLQRPFRLLPSYVQYAYVFLSGCSHSLLHSHTQFFDKSKSPNSPYYHQKMLPNDRMVMQGSHPPSSRARVRDETRALHHPTEHRFIVRCNLRWKKR